MRRITGFVLSVAAGLAVCAAGFGPLAWAEEKSEEGFVSLFNGKDFTGWHKNPQKIGHGTGAHWVVEDGAIVGEQDPPGSGNGGILLTDEKFRDFEVVFECKPDWAEFDGKVAGVCSGFFLRSNDKGQCYQVMVDFHEDGNVGQIYGEGLGGFTNRTFSLKGEYSNKNGGMVLEKILAVPANSSAKGAGGESPFDLNDWSKIWKLNDWNEVRARMVGNPPTITTWINGTKVSDFVGKEKFDQLGDEGSIAVQVHGGKNWPAGAKTRFRNLRVKRLDKKSNE